MAIKVLFNLEFLYHRAALDPVYHAMKRHGGFEIFHSIPRDSERKLGIFPVSLKKKIARQLESEGFNLTEETRGFDVVVSGDVLKDPKAYGDALLVLINHGGGIKNVFYRLLRRQPDVPYEIFVEGPYRKRKLEEKGVLGASRVHLIGYTKLDPAFQGQFDRESILKRWGLDPKKRTILFAPTYKPTSIPLIKDEIAKATEGYNLVIKLHPYSYRGKYAPKSHLRLYQKVVRQYEHAVLLPAEEHNIVPWLVASDVIVSEASSTILEMLALGKFGVIFDLPCEKLRHHDGEPILDEDNRRFLEGAFVHVHDKSQLREAIAQALSPTDEMKAAAERYRALFFYKLDGHASDRAVAKILELLGRN